MFANILIIKYKITDIKYYISIKLSIIVISILQFNHRVLILGTYI